MNSLDLVEDKEEELQAGDASILNIQYNKESVDDSQKDFIPNPPSEMIQQEPLIPSDSRLIDKPRNIYEKEYEQVKGELRQQGTPFIKPEIEQRYGAIEGIVKATPALIAKESFVGSSLTYGLNASQTKWMGLWTDPNFDPTTDEYIPFFKNIDERYWPSLISQPNQYAFNARLEQIEFEEAINKTADRAAWWQQIPGYLGAGLLDLYATGGYGNIAMTTNAAKQLVTGNLRQVLTNTAVKPAALEALRESMLHTNQETRTIQESLIGIGVAGSVGGALGVYGKYTDGKLLAQAKELLQKNNEGKVVKFAANAKGEATGFNVYDKSVGAASAKHYDFKELAIYGTGDNGEFNWFLSPFLKATGWLGQSPVIKGLMSKSVTMRRFTAGMLENNLDIGGDLIGKTRNTPLQQSINKAIAKDVVDVDAMVGEGYLKHLGIDVDNKNVLTANAQKWLKNKNMTLDQFTDQVSKSVRDGGKSQYPVVAEIATKIIKEKMDPLFEKLVEQGHLKAGVKGFGSGAHWLSRQYNQTYLSQNFNKAKGQLADEYEKIQARILKEQEPLENLKELVKAAKQKRKQAVTPEQISKADKELTTLERKTKKMIAQFDQNMRDGKIDEDLLVGERGFTTDELKQYKALKSESNSIKLRIKQLEEENAVISRAENKGRKPGQENKPLTERQAVINQELKLAKEDLKAFRQKLKEGVESETISRNVARKGFNDNYYLNKKNLGSLQFRKVVDRDELEESASATITKILGLSPDQMTAELQGLAKSGAGTNFLKSRTLLLSDKTLDEMGFLEKDIRKTLDTYFNRAHKLIESTEFLKEQGWKGDKDPKAFFAEELADDYALIRGKLDADYKAKLEKSTGKQKEKLDKKYQREQEDLTKKLENDKETANAIWDRITGPAPEDHKGMTRLFRFSNKWLNATALNSLILLQLQDLITPAFKVGWKAQVMDGLLPYIGRSLLPGNKANAAFRREARNMALATETTLAFYGKSWNVASGDVLPKSFRLLGLDIPAEHYMDVIARIQSVWNLSAPMADMTLTIGSMSAQAAIMDALRLSTKGKLTKKGARFLAQSGIDPNSAIGKSIVRQMEAHSQKLSGSRLANTQLWNDPVAAKAFSDAVYRNVKGTIFGGPNPATWPMWAGDPRGRGASLMKFMGYGFTAIHNYLIPTMQGVSRGEVDRLSTMAMMVMISSTVEPLRAIGQGRKPDLDPKHLLVGGLMNSGILGTYADLYNKANYWADIFPHSKTDRFKYTRGLLNSAPEKLLIEGSKLTGMLVNADVNKKDITTILKTMFPMSDAYYMKPVTRKFVESLKIPEKRTVTAAE